MEKSTIYALQIYRDSHIQNGLWKRMPRTPNQNINCEEETVLKLSDRQFSGQQGKMHS